MSSPLVLHLVIEKDLDRKLREVLPCFDKCIITSGVANSQVWAPILL
jgi:hypothetical protein